MWLLLLLLLLYCIYNAISNATGYFYDNHLLFSPQVFKPSVDTEGVLSGSAKHTEVLLLAILGVFLGLFILGVLVEFFVKKWGKWPCKPTLRKYFFFPSEFKNLIHVI